MHPHRPAITTTHALNGTFVQRTKVSFVYSRVRVAPGCRIRNQPSPLGPTRLRLSPPPMEAVGLTLLKRKGNAAISTKSVMNDAETQNTGVESP
jgi:hypothetical protein